MDVSCYSAGDEGKGGKRTEVTGLSVQAEETPAALASMNSLRKADGEKMQVVSQSSNVGRRDE